MKFTSPEQALKWAYKTAKKPDANEHLERACSIFEICENSLTPLQLDYVKAQFGSQKGVSDTMALHLTANFGIGIYSRKSIDQIIRAYCGEKIGLREIRKSLQCGMLKAVSLRNRAYDALDAIHAQAMDRLSMEMEARGLLIGEIAGRAL